MPASAPSPQQRTDFDYIALTAVVLVSWEIALHLWQDLIYLRTAKWYKKPVFWAYFIQRYGAFAVVIAETLIRIGHPKSCHAAGLVSLTVGGVGVLPSVSLIYFFRVQAIWNKNKTVTYTLAALWVILFGASLTAPFSQAAGNLPTGGCTVVRTEKYTPASFIANAVYDAVVFILTLCKLLANRREYKNFQSPVQTLLLRDGILYFFISVVVGIIDIIFLEAITNPAIASTVIPMHIALTSIMTTRLVNNVFHVMTQPSGQGYVGSGTQVGSGVGSGARQGTQGSGRPKNTATSAVNKDNKSRFGVQPPSSEGRDPSSLLHMVSAGSGVGTEAQTLNDEDVVKVVAGDLEHGYNHDGHQTYAVPMQVRVTQETLEMGSDGV
ncbi:hypothetical protein NEOLEDRAFT_1068144 [Neolentinus lepideus HHB14362 ss-1]|uniref:Integral membrane protein n=1 Tax=Neolentinus lepideus HHB14362 ss-1 TaxID=1314782 RepID=A0A165RQD0_9AGAM|nr:hypothetical protein NEOLEDRAFT_1068144 [Neolentinus lepideus HHB14362 ss-1]